MGILYSFSFVKYLLNYCITVENKYAKTKFEYISLRVFIIIPYKIIFLKKKI